MSVIAVPVFLGQEAFRLPDFLDGLASLGIVEISTGQLAQPVKLVLREPFRSTLQLRVRQARKPLR